MPTELRPYFKRIYMWFMAIILICTIFSGIMFILSQSIIISLIVFALPVGLSTPMVVSFMITEQRHHYLISKEEIIVRGGIINRTTRSIPIANIDNLTINRTLSDRFIGIGTISIDTPGGTGYELVLKYVEINSLRKAVRDIKAAMKRYHNKTKVD
ncbi:MAG: PH domain-containing protein [Candidatus Micrarchaeota archaeon]